MRRLEWFSSAEVWLSTQPWTNLGLRTCDIGLRIADMADPGSQTLRLRARLAATGGLIVGTSSMDPEVHAIIVADIYKLLEQMLAELVKP